MIQVLFTTSDKIVSKIIRNLTREDMSHVVIRVGNSIIQSSLWGVEIIEYSKFASSNTIIQSLDINLDPVIVLDNFTQHQYHWYDWLGLLYLGLRFICLRFFKVKLPKANLWQITGMFTCTELITEILEGEENSEITPYNLFLQLKEKYA